MTQPCMKSSVFSILDWGKGDQGFEDSVPTLLSRIVDFESYLVSQAARPYHCVSVLPLLGLESCKRPQWMILLKAVNS